GGAQRAAVGIPADKDFEESDDVHLSLQRCARTRREAAADLRLRVPAMRNLTPVAGALLLVCWGWPDTGQAAPDDVTALRTELEARIRELESSVAARNAPAAAASAASLTAPAAAPAAPYAAAPARSSNLTAFNPAVSVILTGNYASLTQDPATYRIAGFIPPHR